MSPTIHREAGFRFYFRMGDLKEPAHIHVERMHGGSGYAKIWLEPALAVEFMVDFNDQERKTIIKITAKHKTSFLERWRKERAGANY